MIEYLKWDTDFFGFKVGRIFIDISEPEKIEAVHLIAKENKYDLVYIFVNNINEVIQHQLEGIGGRLVDIKLTYLQDVSKIEKEVSNIIDNNITSWLNKPVSENLYSLAIQSGIYSRFFVDPNFKNNEFKRLYYTWIENSVNGSLAKEVLVYKEQDIELGFITLGIKRGRVDMGLIAVDESVRGKSIGKKLINSAITKAIDWNYKVLQVVTQAGNKNACSFYEYCGFTLISRVYIYHLWLK